MSTCQEWAPLLALSPEEITDSGRAAALAGHVAHCADCQRGQAAFAALREAVRASASRHPAPPVLRERIIDALARPPAHKAPAAPARAGRGLWIGLASGWLAAAALAGALAMSLLHGPLPADPREAASPWALADLGDRYVDNHARALVTGHLIDVASSDRHTVKPWFRGRLDFSPPVADLQEQGYTLLGGRLDYVRQRSLAVLVYQRRQHIIDVYLWPEAAGAASMAVAADARGALGYHSVRGNAAGVGFTAVSDLDPVELRDLARIFGQALQAQAGNGTPQ